MLLSSSYLGPPEHSKHHLYQKLCDLISAPFMYRFRVIPSYHIKIFSFYRLNWHNDMIVFYAATIIVHYLNSLFFFSPLLLLIVSVIIPVEK